MASLDLCARCGRCLSVCPVYGLTRQETTSPRGRAALAQALLRGEDLKASIFFLCLLCGACERACPNQVPLLSSFLEVRRAGASWFKRSLACFFEPPYPEKLFQLVRKSGLHALLGTEVASTHSVSFRQMVSLPPEGDVQLFLGCGADFLYPQATLYLQELLATKGFTLGFSPGQGCCGLAALSLGNEEVFQHLALANIKALSRTQGPVVTLCASCYFTLKEVYPRFFAGTRYEKETFQVASRVKEATFFLLEQGFSWSREKGVALHLPCHLRFSGETPWWETLPFPVIAECCGQGGTFGLFQPSRALKIFQKGLARSLTEYAPDLLLTNCTACYYQLHTRFRGFPRVRLPLEVMES